MQELNNIWLTWSFHEEHTLQSTRDAFAGKYRVQAPTAIQSLLFELWGMDQSQLTKRSNRGCPKKKSTQISHDFFIACCFSLAKQHLQGIRACTIPIFLWFGRFLCFEVSEVDIILAGHDHHYDVKPVGPHGTYVCSSRWLIFGRKPGPSGSGSICMKAYRLRLHHMDSQNSDSQKRHQDWQKHRLYTAHEVLKSGTDFRDITAGSWEQSR